MATKRKTHNFTNSPLIHIDVFMKTAIPLFKLSNMEVAGFRTYMRGRLYQPSMEDFIRELEKYLQKKLQ